LAAVYPEESSYLFVRAQQLLFVLVGITFIFFLASRIVPKRPMTTSALLEEASLSNDPAPKEKAALRPFEEYNEAIASRDLFQEGFVSKEEGGTTPPPQSRLKDLALIGIISGKTPQAIIEDKKEQKTYFLRTGEMLGNLRVEQILEERVTLSDDGEQFDLIL